MVKIDIVTLSVVILGTALLSGFIAHRLSDSQPPSKRHSQQTPVHTILKDIEDPVLALDANSHILNYNSAAESTFPGLPEYTNKELADFSPTLADAIETNSPYQPTPQEVLIDPEKTDLIFDVQQTSFDDLTNTEIHELVVLREITERYTHETSLEQLQRATEGLIRARSMEEIESTVQEAVSTVVPQNSTAILKHDPLRDGFHPISTDNALIKLMRSTDVFEHDFGTPESSQILFSSDHLTEVLDTGEITTAIRRDSPKLFEQYGFDDEGFEVVLFTPLGDHGVLIVGSHDDRVTPMDYIHFFRIIARSTEEALSRLDHLEELRAQREQIHTQKEQIEFFNGLLRHHLLNGMMVVQGNAVNLESHVDEAGQKHLDTIIEWTEDLVDRTRKVRTLIETVTQDTNDHLELRNLSDELAIQANRLNQNYPEVQINNPVEEDVYVLGGDLLGDILDHLLRNAVEHNDKETPKIDISLIKGEDMVQLRIRDNGPGIPDEKKRKVFDRDETADGSGVGFGLYFVKSLAEEFYGSVWFEDPAEGEDGVIAVVELSTGLGELD